ncbi:MAG: response regulator [Granulosicoccus sp.]
MNPISVVIVDDHTLFRTGLSELLSRRGLRVAGMSGEPADALGLVEREKPDILLLDLRMREIGGLEVLRRVRESFPDQRVVILTTSIEESDLLEALRLGASGYLLKDMEPDGFVDLLYKAKAGDTVVAPDLTGLLARAAVSREETGKQDSVNVYRLTPREMDILSHIAKGQSNKDIAIDLGITDGTVKLHVRAVMKKLGVQSRVQAAVLAVSEGLCDS